MARCCLWKYIIGIVMFSGIFVPDANSQKTGFRFKDKTNTGLKSGKGKDGNASKFPREIIAAEIVAEDTVGMAEGSFMVASQCEACNNGYRLDQIRFSGFDKVLKSNKESFYIKNNTDRTITSIVLYIDYRMPDDRQLTKRFLRLTCRIPAGERRKADIPTFDVQHSYYYKDSTAPKRGGNPFKVIFDPVAYYLQF